MTENKLYALCREEARKIIYDNIGVSNIKYDLAQLTAEIYGMKLLDMSQPIDCERPYYLTEDALWFKHKRNEYPEEIHIGTTQQLHDHFVREFNQEVGK